jgi:hypothetical protein
MKNSKTQNLTIKTGIQNTSTDLYRDDIVYSVSGLSPSSPSPAISPSSSSALAGRNISPLQTQVFDYKNITQAKKELDEAMQLLSAFSVSSSKSSASTPKSSASATPNSSSMSPTSTAASRVKKVEAPAVNRWKSSLGPVKGDWTGVLDALRSPSRTHFESELYARLLSRKLPVNQYFFFVFNKLVIL